MGRGKLFIYNKEMFNEFYQKTSTKYRIIPISLLFNSQYEFEETYLDYDYLNDGNLSFDDEDKEILIDITLLAKLLAVRSDILFHYGVIIDNLYRRGDVEIVVEYDYSEKMMELFPLQFYEKENLTSIEETSTKDEFDKSHKSLSKDVVVYDKDNYDEYINAKRETGIHIISITKVLKKNNSIDYSIERSLLNKEEKYILDITSMIRLVNGINELVLSFEIILHELIKLNNISFIIDKEVQDKCKELFKYSFQEYIEISSTKEDKSDNELKKEVSVFTNQDMNLFLERFEEELFGHDEFKKDFRKQIHKYKIMNKIGEEKIFSIFLCGDSGIGKTEVARVLQRNLYNNTKEIKINFGNYSGQGSLWSLIGSPKGYKGSESGGELTNKILNSDSKVILIDEFEKADKEIFSFFYELLEDGKYTDLDGKEINLEGYIIVFTSNLTEKNYKNVIPEALFSRFSMRYIFVPLTSKDKEEFIRYRAEKIIKKYNENFENEFDCKKMELLFDIPIDKLNNLRDINIELTNRFTELI
ncbi:ATP-dependent Clp protease ATP-binding subunit [Clostridium sp. PL3]|uniref:ATP-dependent Clp protease ATP-binding subunit n=1 Tax=Clostridium thailandense TaxID=2794346 RepID=A0A949WXX9_9CLOT|nr:AAA family ATPase [Clostridium thailandense]MBV7276472.1 ATP-dependent Clp protease ATP-binding subunit [Clostridium thailandense]